MSVTIRPVSPQHFPQHLDSLCELLRDAVDSGASVGFLPPLAPEEARQYWQGIAAALPSQEVLLLVAEKEGNVVGTAQLHLATKANAAHRAEVAKVLVHSTAQRQGIGRQLMHAVEELAQQHQRTTLVLDTLEGASSELLYQGLGYTAAGAIPEYARVANGALEATVVYYKLLR
ncbi:GNAT family N-acetyltransferase [Hymenobacter seoulensis]